MNEIKIIIAGTRTFDDFSTLVNIVNHIITIKLYKKGYKASNIEIVSGTAKGADTLGISFAEAYGHNVKHFPAEWDKFGKSAGYIRNKQMAEYVSYRKGYGALIAFWDGKSKGTKHMIDLAKEYGLDTFVYFYNEGIGIEIKNEEDFRLFYYREQLKEGNIEQ